MIPRGIKNNNPGNIRKGKDQWQGMSADQSSDTAFVVFDGPQWGIRALVKILLNYQRDGLDTIARMINRWAPPADHNDTSAYALAVARGVGVEPDTKVQVANYAIASRMVKAMIKVECAGFTYPPEVLAEGLRLAGIIVPAVVASGQQAAPAVSSPRPAPPSLVDARNPLRGSANRPAGGSNPLSSSTPHTPSQDSPASAARPWWASLLDSILRALKMGRG